MWFCFPKSSEQNPHAVKERVTQWCTGRLEGIRERDIERERKREDKRQDESLYKILSLQYVASDVYFKCSCVTRNVNVFFLGWLLVWRCFFNIFTSWRSIPPQKRWGRTGLRRPRLRRPQSVRPWRTCRWASGSRWSWALQAARALYAAVWRARMGWGVHTAPACCPDTADTRTRGSDSLCCFAGLKSGRLCPLPYITERKKVSLWKIQI